MGDEIHLGVVRGDRVRAQRKLVRKPRKMTPDWVAVHAAKLTYTELRDLCKAYKLTQKGKKAELKERLVTCPAFVASLSSPLDPYWEPVAKKRTRDVSAVRLELLTPQNHQQVPDPLEETEALLTPLPFAVDEDVQSPMARTPAPLHPLTELTPELHRKTEFNSKCYMLLHSPKYTLQSLQDSWLTKVLDKLLCPRLDLSSLSASLADDSSSDVLSTEMEACLRFWTARAFYTIECGHLEWLYNGKVLKVDLLSPDLVVIHEQVVSLPNSSESHRVTAPNSVLYHLVFFQTGQVCDTKSGSSYPQEWRLLARQFPNRPPYERLETSIVNAFSTWIHLFPNCIHYRIPPKSKEYLVALRFLLAHSEGLRGYPEEIALKLKANGHLFKLNLSVPVNLAVVSVDFSFLGYSLKDEVAFIQTYGGEGVYILIETGLSIGTEMDGVSPTWMEILECTTRGLPALP